MDASTTFESVLTSVKQSRLNYLVTRTPLSATICLKRSFSKHQDKPVDEENKGMTKDYDALEERVKTVEKQLKDVELERSRFEDLYKKENIKVKQSAEIESQFRAELLKTKLDKNTLKFTSRIINCENCPC